MYDPNTQESTTAPAVREDTAQPNTAAAPTTLSADDMPKPYALENPDVLRGVGMKAQEMQLPARQYRDMFTPDDVLERGAGVGKLGRALIFVNAKDYDDRLATTLQQLQAFKGLDTQIWVQDMEPLQYLKMATEEAKSMKDMEAELTEPKFHVDSQSYLAQQHNATNYRTIVYQDPFGARRSYDAFDDFDKFTRHVKRVQKQLRQQGQKK